MNTPTHNKDELKRNFFIFAISKTIGVLSGLYLLHTNASVETMENIIIINVLQLIVLLFTSREYWLMASASLSMLDPTNYILHVISIIPSYLFSVQFTSRIAILSHLLIPLSLYTFGWRAQFMLRGWLIIIIGGLTYCESCKRYMHEVITDDTQPSLVYRPDPFSR
jgi:hypothetical protein